MFASRLRDGAARSTGQPLIVAAIALTVAAPLAAQQTGQVVGRVISGQSREPMSNVQISIAETRLGQLSAADGSFRIDNVPAGARTVVAQLIGYGGERQSVNVAAGQAVTVVFELYLSAVQLEGVVVTGTGIAAQKREVGNSIELITSGEIETIGAVNFEDLLRGRAPGLSVTGTTASPGAGSDIVLRGVNSVNGRNTPLIYIDGVRMPSGRLEDSTGEAQEHATFLGDIRPEDIERIEIIKGAAASSLYGTDASAGVIQIFTKKGSPGAPRWTLSVDQGFQRVGHIGPDLDPTGLHVNDCTRQFRFDPAAMDFVIDDTPDPGCPASGSWLRNAYVQDYSVSVRGGNEDVTYFASGGYGDAEGVVPENRATDLNARANFAFHGFRNFEISLHNFYTRRNIDWIPNGDQTEGLLYNVARGAEGETPDNDDALVLDMDQNQVINHFNSSANINWTPRDNLRHRLTFGLDYSNSHFITQRPWLFWNNPEGTRTIDIENRRLITVDYAGSWNHALPLDLGSTLSFGIQYNQGEHLGNRTDVQGFLGPGSKVIENAEEITNVNEDRSATENGGFFVQEQLGWRNRLFVTGGFRADTHSSFGKDYRRDTYFTIYPKVQATYTLSDHTFWPDWFETFRLRAAYGESGEAPPANGSVTIFEASSLADENNLGFIIANIANPRLGPERAREYEGGFDGSLLGGRFVFTATGYYRETTDGLIFVAPPASNGIAENIPQNVGTWKSQGVEMGANAILLDAPGARFSVQANYQHNRTEMVDLGDPQFDEFSFNYLNAYRVGRPIPSLYGIRLENPDAIGELPMESAADTFFYGPSRPPHEIGLGATLTLFDRLTFDAYGVGQYGHMLYDDLAQELAQDGLWPGCWEINERVKADDFADIPTRDIWRCSEDYGAFRNESWFEKADYFRLQTASLRYRLPESWMPGNIASATLQLRATNLFTLTGFSGLYPDALLRPTEQTARGNGYLLPPPRTYTLNLRVTF